MEFVTRKTRINIIYPAPQKCVLATLIILALNACGGSGGESGNNQATAIVYPEINYNGSSRQASLTRQNSIIFLDAVYRLLEPGYSFATLGFSPNAPEPVITQYEATTTDNGTAENEQSGCESGTLDVNRDAKQKKISLVYANCTINGVTANGQMVFTDKSTSQFLKGEVEISYLGFDNGFEKSEFAGRISLGQDGIQIQELTFFSKRLGTTYFTDNLNISPFGEIKGRIYQSEFGFVEISYSNFGDKTLFISGADESRLEALHNDLNRSGQRLDRFSLSLYESPTSEENPVLTTNIPLPQLFDWPYNNNLAPTPSVGENLSADRLATLDISAESSSDPNYDFLSYEWRHLSAPENCIFSLSGNTGINTDLVSECQGEHQLELSVFDGFTTSTKVFSIDIEPLAASFEPVDSINLSTNEAIDLDISSYIKNLTEDGPFTYKLGYAPNGIEIDNDGIISGIPKPFISEKNPQFNLAIDVENGRNSRVEFIVNVNSEGKPKSILASSTLCSRENLKWSDIDGNNLPDLICPLNNSYTQYEIVDDSILLKYVELTPPSYEQLLNIIQTDMNDDSIAEVILGYENQVVVIDGQSKEILKRYTLPEAFSDSRYTLNSTPENFSGFILSPFKRNGFNGSERSYYYSLTSDQPITIKVGGISVAGDYNQDKILDIIHQNRIISLDGNSIELSKEITDMTDYDGDGEIDLISLQDNGSNSSVGLTMEVINPDTDTASLRQEISIPSLLSKFSRFTEAKGFLLNTDNDIEKELILCLSSSLDRGLFLFQFNGSKYIFDRKISDEISFTNDQVLQLTPEKIIFKGNTDNLTYSDLSELKELKYLSPAFSSRSGVSIPYIQKNNSINLYYNSNRPRVQVGKINLTLEGKINSLKLLESTESPQTMNGLIEAGITSGSAEEIVIAKSRFGERGQGYGEYRVYNTDADQLVSEARIEPEISSSTRLVIGDINNDKQIDIFAESASSRGNALSWIDLTTGTELWSMKPDIKEHSLIARDTIISDIDNDGNSELVTLLIKSFTFGPELRIYQAKNSALTLTHSIDVSPQSSVSEPKDFGLQDIDADGKQEIIILAGNSCRYKNSTSTIEVIDDDFEKISRVEVKGCIESIPSIPAKTAKSNLLASIELREPEISSGRKQYTQFAEIDPLSGSIIWKSSLFLGQFNQHSLTILGDDAYDSRKAAVFQAGFYTFQ